MYLMHGALSINIATFLSFEYFNVFQYAITYGLKHNDISNNKDKLILISYIAFLLQFTLYPNQILYNKH